MDPPRTPSPPSTPALSDVSSDAPDMSPFGMSPTDRDAMPIPNRKTRAAEDTDDEIVIEPTNYTFRPLFGFNDPSYREPEDPTSIVDVESPTGSTIGDHQPPSPRARVLPRDPFEDLVFQGMSKITIDVNHGSNGNADEGRL